MKTHAFTQSGLGESPFKICSWNNPGALKNGSFFCEHCGRMLKNRFFVKSADGRVSVVGIDCLKKTDDVELFESAKNERKEVKEANKKLVLELKMTEKESRERNALDGFTKSEYIELLMRELTKQKELMENEIDSNDSIDLISGSSPFVDDVLYKCSTCTLPTTPVINVLVDILTKKISGARKNSVKYKAALPGAKKSINEFMVKVKVFEDKKETIELRISELVNTHY